MEWGGTDRAVMARMNAYETQVYETLGNLAEAFAPMIETAAKDGAPWTDQTGNARQTLRCRWRFMDKSKVEIVLSHGMGYGIFLELANQGVYAIILPTLEWWAPQLMESLRRVLR